MTAAVKSPPAPRPPAGHRLHRVVRAGHGVGFTPSIPAAALGGVLALTDGVWSSAMDLTIGELEAQAWLAAPAPKTTC